MKRFSWRLLDHLPIIVGVSVSIVVTLAIVVPFVAWSQHVEIKPMTAHVVAVGASETGNIYCDSSEIEDELTLLYCSSTKYPITFSVQGTDETFTANYFQALPINSAASAYKVIEGDSSSYRLSSPVDGGTLARYLFLAIASGLIAGILTLGLRPLFNK